MFPCQLNQYTSKAGTFTMYFISYQPQIVKKAYF